MGRFSDGFNAADMFDKEMKEIFHNKEVPVKTQQEFAALNKKIASKIDNAETAIMVSKALLNVAKMFI